MKMSTKSVLAGAAIAYAVVVSAVPASAASTGLAVMDAAGSAATTVIFGVAGIAAIVLLGLSIWDFAEHRKMPRFLVELVGVVLAGVIAVNAGAVATFFHINGAVL